MNRVDKSEGRVDFDISFFSCRPSLPRDEVSIARPGLACQVYPCLPLQGICCRPSNLRMSVIEKPIQKPCRSIRIVRYPETNPWITGYGKNPENRDMTRVR